MTNNKILFLLIVLFLANIGLLILGFIHPEFDGPLLGISVFLINAFIFIGILNKLYRRLFLWFFILLFIIQFLAITYEQHLQHQGNQFGNISLLKNHYWS